ncbi:16S rRNA (uracil(1498)-N(3))-methyltransferase [Paludibacterium purpuratum]|uniref:Ribosomal RNA small subunit methyltransferase E n=1 Tax=Paludibacterium purpuratum TaxID=1144873 RepID=A0A4R7B092_9NEIS|nr:16S rRNA (uracil(1498)-N(3))-methyltransferase [Paludibacterium purpuratum]TDR72503.1 16S rRNA (uracil1498-N3)-methyltransferase [Paludibacterium purpuratum]
MARFFVDVPLHPGLTLDLPEPVVRHLQVLRLREGEALTLFNGLGGEFSATLTQLGRREALCELGAHDAVSRESPIWLGLAQAISSGERMDFTLQKGVEMGVSVFQPLAARRSVVKLSGERADKRLQRWQEIVVSACEQSGRTVIPQVLPILSVEEWLARQDEVPVRLLLSPLGSKRLVDIAQRPAAAWLMAGPEGGYTSEEEQAALDAGWTPLKLGGRVLRTETAALAAVAALQTVWGDYAFS